MTILIVIKLFLYLTAFGPMAVTLCRCRRAGLRVADDMRARRQLSAMLMRRMGFCHDISCPRPRRRTARTAGAMGVASADGRKKRRQLHDLPARSRNSRSLASSHRLDYPWGFLATLHFLTSEV